MLIHTGLAALDTKTLGHDRPLITALVILSALTLYRCWQGTRSLRNIHTHTHTLTPTVPLLCIMLDFIAFILYLCRAEDVDECFAF